MKDIRRSKLAINLGLWKKWRVIDFCKNWEGDEEICEYCQQFIIKGPAMSQHYMCEGSHCEEALDSYLDNELDAIHYDRWYRRLSRSINKKITPILNIMKKLLKYRRIEVLRSFKLSLWVGTNDYSYLKLGAGMNNSLNEFVLSLHIIAIAIELRYYNGKV